MGGIKAIVLCGGPSKGTRFRPLSLDLPKPLFPVAGRPMILHHIEAATKLPGLQEVLLLGFYEEALFQSFIHSTSTRFGVQIRYLQEDGEMGSGGGLYAFADTILEGDPEHVVVMHSDIACTFPLVDMLDFHNAHAGTASIMGTRVASMADGMKFGCIVHGEDSKQVKHFVDKPETSVSSMINAGTYVFNAGVIADMREQVRSRPTTPVRRLSSNFQFLKRQDSNAASLERDVVMPLASSHQLYLFEEKGFWLQIKTPGAALEASQAYMAFYRSSHRELVATDSDRRGGLIGDVVIHPTAQVHPTAVLGPGVTIGAGVYVGEGVRVLDAILLEGVQVQAHAFIRSSIIGWGSSVGEWSRVEGVADAATAPMGACSILGGGVTVDPELVIRNAIVLPHKRLTQSYTNQILL